MLLFPTKIIPPPCTQGKAKLRCLQRLAVLECKDTNYFIQLQDFSEKIWNYQKKYLSLQHERNLFRMGAPVGLASDSLK